MRWAANRASGAKPVELALPWFSWSAIEQLDRLPLEGLRVFEFGGGGSTLYFLKRGCIVRTAENSRDWAALVLNQAQSRGWADRLDLRIVDMPEHPSAEHRELVDSYVSQIEDEKPWHVVVVDGVDGTPSTRMLCLERARTRVAPDGLIVLDDSWRDEYRAAPKVLAGFAQTAHKGLGPARWGVTRTDIYTAAIDR
jgi:hypothetical protein